MIKFAPSLSIALTLSWRGMGSLAINLDDDIRALKLEVDASDRDTTAPVDHLTGRSRQPRFPYEFEEAPLKCVGATGVYEDLIERTDTRPPPASQRGEPRGQVDRTGCTLADGRVNGSLKLAG
jgi:hypothetical protein